MESEEVSSGGNRYWEHHESCLTIVPTLETNRTRSSGDLVHSLFIQWEKTRY